MIKATCGGLILDNVTITTINGIITPIEKKNPIEYIVPNCSGVRFNKESFQVVNGVLTVIEAQEAEIEPMIIPQQGCGGLCVDGKYFKMDEHFGLSVDWDLIPEQDKK